MTRGNVALPMLHLLCCDRRVRLKAVMYSRRMSSASTASAQSVLCSRCYGDGYRWKYAESAKRQRPADSIVPERKMFQQTCKTCLGRGLVVDGIAPLTAAALPTPSLKVAIIGAGIGGAALALALQHRGIRTVVYERDCNFDARHQGYGLTMQQGIRSSSGLAALGLCHLHGIVSVEHCSYSPAGVLLGTYGKVHRQCGADSARAGDSEEEEESPAAHVRKGRSRGRDREEDEARHNFHIPRQGLRQALLQALAPGTVVWGKRLAAYTERPDTSEQVTLTFIDGTTDSADVLVGADGIHSMVRKLKLGESSDPCPLRYLGVMVVLGIAASSHPAVQQRIFQTLDGETRIYAMPFKAAQGCGQTDALCTCMVRGACSPPLAMWQLSFPVTELEARGLAHCPATLKAEAIRRCNFWHAPVPTLLEDTALELMTGYPAYDRDVLDPSQLRRASGASVSAHEGTAMPGPAWAGNDYQSRVTLIGDAAHPMSPFKGQGANQALLDGVSLARRLHQVVRGRAGLGWPASIPEALALAEAEMLQRTAGKVHGSRAAAEYLHTPAAVTPANCTRAAAAKAALQAAKR